MSCCSKLCCKKVYFWVGLYYTQTQWEKYAKSGNMLTSTIGTSHGGLRLKCFRLMLALFRYSEGFMNRNIRIEAYSEHFFRQM